MAETTPSAPAGNVYSEAQHFSLLRSAVEQETASLTTEKSELASRIESLESEKAALATELSEAQTRIDVLESDKATAEAAAETAKQEVIDFKAEIQRAADVAEKKSSRRERVQTANENLADGYFTDERVTRWAEMSDEDFDGLVAEMTEFAAAGKTAAATEPETKTTEKASESAAFTGGETPASKSASTLKTFLGLTQASA